MVVVQLDIEDIRLSVLDWPLNIEWNLFHIDDSVCSDCFLALIYTNLFGFFVIENIWYMLYNFPFEKKKNVFIKDG